MEDWKKEIAILIYIKQEIDNLDEDKILPYSLPNLAAKEDQIKAVEERIGHALDTKYSQFLRFANGWKNFYLTVDLFGTEELIGNNKMSYANQVLDVLDREKVLEDLNLVKNYLIPIAATTEDRDLFVITHPSSSSPGVIIWFSGYEIERFQNFDEFFLSMVDYNRTIYQKFAEEKKTE